MHADHANKPHDPRQAKKAHYGTASVGYIGIKATEDTRRNLKAIRDLLTTPEQPVSVSVGCRRAIAHYAEFLRRIGEDRRQAEMKSALAKTYAAA
jgi:hypothetical protein